MKWNDYSHLRLSHSFMSPSQYAWLNYTPDKLKTVYMNNLKKQEGTELHELASELIVRRIKLAPLKKAFNQFVNDSIGFNMESEKMLFYSLNCYGTADAIKFTEDDNGKVLRVYDLKTGVTKPSFKQLDIYSAIFCLEYNKDPYDIVFIERLYQDNGFIEQIQEPDLIADIMAKIIAFDKELEEFKTTI